MRMPPRDRVREDRYHAEERYKRYQKEVTDLLSDAQGMADRGMWSEAANKLNSALMTIGAMSGCCRELNLIYLLIEE
jgi:hypothetical protein